MRAFFRSYGSKLYVGFAVALVGAVSIVANAAAAVPYDLSGSSSFFTDEIDNAVTTALPIGGGVMALFVGWRILRRIVKG